MLTTNSFHSFDKYVFKSAVHKNKSLQFQSTISFDPNWTALKTKTSLVLILPSKTKIKILFSLDHGTDNFQSASSAAIFWYSIFMSNIHNNKPQISVIRILITGDQRQRQFILKHNVMILSWNWIFNPPPPQMESACAQESHQRDSRPQTHPGTQVKQFFINSQNLWVSHLSEVSVAIDVKFGKHALRSQNGVLSREVVLKRVICFWSWHIMNSLRG